MRPVRREDLAAIVALERLCFPGPAAYSRSRLRYLLFRARSLTLVAESQEADGGQGKLPGFTVALLRKGSDVAGVETVNVDPAWRGQGLARTLLVELETRLSRLGYKRMRLEVAEANLAARRVYEGLGYRTKAVLPHYYHYPPSSALRMVKNLPTSSTCREEQVRGPPAQVPALEAGSVSLARLTAMV